MGASAISTGLLLGTSISNPYFLPVALIPGRIKNLVLEKYKESKKKGILKPIEYPKFKI